MQTPLMFQLRLSSQPSKIKLTMQAKDKRTHRQSCNATDQVYIHLLARLRSCSRRDVSTADPYIWRNAHEDLSLKSYLNVPVYMRMYFLIPACMHVERSSFMCVHTFAQLFSFFLQETLLIEGFSLSREVVFSLSLLFSSRNEEEEEEEDRDQPSLSACTHSLCENHYERQRYTSFMLVLLLLLLFHMLLVKPLFSPGTRCYVSR